MLMMVVLLLLLLLPPMACVMMLPPIVVVVVIVVTPPRNIGGVVVICPKGVSVVVIDRGCLICLPPSKPVAAGVIIHILLKCVCLDLLLLLLLDSIMFIPLACVVII